MNINIEFRDLLHLIQLSEYDADEIRMFTLLADSLRKYFGEHLIQKGSISDGKYFKFEGNIFDLPSSFYNKDVLAAADESYMLLIIKVVHLILPASFYSSNLEEISYCSDTDNTTIRFKYFGFHKKEAIKEEEDLI